MLINFGDYHFDRYFFVTIPTDTGQIYLAIYLKLLRNRWQDINFYANYPFLSWWMYTIFRSNICLPLNAFNLLTQSSAKNCFTERFHFQESSPTWHNRYVEVLKRYTILSISDSLSLTEFGKYFLNPLFIYLLTNVRSQISIRKHTLVIIVANKRFYEAVLNWASISWFDKTCVISTF